MSINLDRDGHFDGQAYIDIPDESKPRECVAILTPKYGLYKGAEIKFGLSIPESFPDRPPRCTALTKIFHCNISGSSVCFNLFSSEYKSGMPLSTYIVGLLWFLDNPNPDSPLNSSCVERNKEKLTETCTRCILGLLPGYPACRSENLDPSINIHFLKLTMREYLHSLAQGQTVIPLSRLCLSEGTDLECELRPDDEFLDTLSDLDGNLIRPAARLRACTSITSRHKLLSSCIGDIDVVEPEQIMKEMVFELDGKAVIVFTHGHDRVDIQQIAELLQVDIEKIALPTRSRAAQLVNLSAITWFDRDSYPKDATVIFNSKILEQSTIYVQFFGSIFVQLNEPTDLMSLQEGDTFMLADLDPQVDCESTSVTTGHEKRAEYYFKKEE